MARLDALLPRAESRSLTLDDLVVMVRAPGEGDREAGRQAWEICQGLARTEDGSLADLGKALLQILAGVSPETALAGLPGDLRTRILEALPARA